MSREHILLFENERGLKRIMTLLLRQAQMRVTGSDSADRALDIIRSASDEGDKVSAVIIDVSYPNPEGEKLLINLQEEWAIPSIIVITQYGNEDTIKRSGSNISLLAAPFEPNELLKSIKTASFQIDNQEFPSNQCNEEEAP